VKSVLCDGVPIGGMWTERLGRSDRLGSRALEVQAGGQTELRKGTIEAAGLGKQTFLQIDLKAD